MPTIVVDVMPKAELLDPQGKAVAGALSRTGHEAVSGVRIGKRFELTVDGPVDDAVRADIEQIAADILSNGVIEDVVAIHWGDDDVTAPPADDTDSETVDVSLSDAELAEAKAASPEASDGVGYDAPAGETH